jgi:colicin import membrane protein
MNKAYFIIPFIALGIFTGFYMNFAKGYEAKLAEQKARQEQVKKDKAKQEIANREAAIKAAVDAQEKRKKEKEAKEKIEEEKRVARQVAEDQRDRAHSDRLKLTDQARRLKKDLDDVNAEIKKIEEEKKTLVDEQAFLKTYVKQAEANVKYYYDLLDKIAVAEKARADAAAAAAAAAKKS